MVFQKKKEFYTKKKEKKKQGTDGDCVGFCIR
jgi:hypothetical protein